MFKWLADVIKKLIEAAAKWVEKCIPEYEPSAWNDGDGIQLNNNCYNYGCDIQTNTYAQPGRAHGLTVSQSDLDDCTAVHNGAVADGLKPVDCDQGCGCEECQHQVALVLSPGWDYHWYRKDRDGRWSHKMAWTPATNLDNSDNIITDPRTADRGSYTIFCGCFCVNKSKVTIG
jgi:hypothetical protein